MNRREACSAAGKSSMYVVNLIKRYKTEGLTHDQAHLKALHELRTLRVIFGKNTKYVDTRIKVLESRLT